MPHPSVAARLARLSEDQRRAATAPPGPVLCVAPAGSGKTTTLVARVAWLIDAGVQPAELCVLTFNARAAEELRLRLTEALAPIAAPAEAIRVRTFHALGREILREAGRPVEPLVDRMAVLEELEGGALPGAAGQWMDTAISRLKLELRVETEQLAREVAEDRAAGRPVARIIELFLAYEGELARRGGLDYDDLVRGALDLLDADPAVLGRWRARCAHLLVDEVQDLDRSQLVLALRLAAPANRLFLVGDDDQTIYAWRLADVRRILRLEEELPGLSRFDLVTNRRCPPSVVERAVRLVAHNRERFVKRVEAAPDATGSLLLAPDGGDDVARARRLFAQWPSPGSAAVLARTRAELAPVAGVALERRLPYRAADDGLLLDEPLLDELLLAARRWLEVRTAPAGRGDHLLALAAARGSVAGVTSEVDLVCGALLAWAAGVSDLDALEAALADRRAVRHSFAEGSSGEAAITLATVHATKGLEFDHVVCVGLDEGRFPSARSVAEAPEPERTLEEERRLAYVAWTRARRSLVLLYDPDAPSSFLSEAFDEQELDSAAVR